MTRRLFIAFVALIAAWLGVASESSAAELAPQFAAATYTYDGLQGSDALARAATERGPPVAYDRDTYAAGDRWSRGALARPSGLSLPAVTTYNGTARLAHVDNPRTTPPQHVGVSARSPSSIQRWGVAAKGPIDIRPPLSIGSKQFGTKWGKHAAGYGLDPASSSSRSWFTNRARDVHLNPTEVRRGAWNPSGGGGGNYFFFRQGDDLLITRPGGEFVTTFPGGSTNAWFKNAEVFPH